MLRGCVRGPFVLTRGHVQILVGIAAGSCLQLVLVCFTAV